MFCNKCGRQIPDGSVCPCQQPQQPQYQQAPQYQQPQYQQPQYQQPQYQQAPQYQARPRPAGPSIIAKFSLDKVIAMFVTILTFGLAFINWFSFKGDDKDIPNFGPYGMDSEMKDLDILGKEIDLGLGDFSWLFIVVMILMIINIVVFAFYLITGVINLSAMVPALAGVDLHKLLHKVFYGILVVCLVLGLIAALVGWYSPAYDDYDEFLEKNEDTLEYYEEMFKEDEEETADRLSDVYDEDIESYDDFVDYMWESSILETTLAAGWWITLVFTLIGLVFVLKGDLVSSLLKNATAANYQQPYAPQM